MFDGETNGSISNFWSDRLVEFNCSTKAKSRGTNRVAEKFRVYNFGLKK